MSKTVIKGWGYEIWVENNKLYCGKHLHVLPGKQCSVHYHKKKKETFYIINGELLLTYSLPNQTMLEINDYVLFWKTIADIKTLVLKKGESFTIETLTLHKFTSNTNYPCDFIEFSTHHEESDSYRIIKGH